MAKYTVLQTFYASDKWRNFRLTLITERGNSCQDCGRIIARSIDIIGHHKIELTPENVHDHMISLNPDLVDLVCFDCHNAAHHRFGHQQSSGVYLVYGPPMAGKQAYVRQNMSRGDLVIDMDRLYAAVSMRPFYDKPEILFQNVIGIHNQLIDNVKTRLGKWHTAWIVGGYAEKFKREKLANDLGAELIYCEMSKEQCLHLLERDEERRFRQDEWTRYINKWFDQYRE